jgi:hypothetical protein
MAEQIGRFAGVAVTGIARARPFPVAQAFPGRSSLSGR